ncbi:MAG: glycosyltransferase family 4 protein [Nostoc sp. C3-bin3]|nr:glycosyltransferase family 4 protein [Nostoc sp. C3-bin3]
MTVLNKKIAILVPSAPYGAYWPPILGELNKQFQELKFFTGCVWPKYDPEAFGASVIQLVGKTKLITCKENPNGYNRVFILASPKVIPYLLKFKPDIVFVSGFSIWTLLVILFRIVGHWKIVLVYEGSAPNVDFGDSPFRLFFRRIMVNFADIFISNSDSGKQYLTNVLGVEVNKIFSRPYMVPDSEALLKETNEIQAKEFKLNHPAFLLVGQVVTRKGIHLLLDACIKLKEKGLTDYTVIIAGDGPQRQELEELSRASGLSNQVIWLGWIAYGSLGSYFKMSDVYVFHTLEDTCGMAVLEAMAFGKPIICSKWAGAQEMLVEDENAYVVDPHDADELSEAMAKFITKPDLIPSMGARSRELIARHTPREAADFLSEITLKVLQ